MLNPSPALQTIFLPRSMTYVINFAVSNHIKPVVSGSELSFCAIVYIWFQPCIWNYGNRRLAPRAAKKNAKMQP